MLHGEKRRRRLATAERRWKVQNEADYSDAPCEINSRRLPVPMDRSPG
jgi:hypothetical protein